MLNKAASEPVDIAVHPLEAHSFAAFGDIISADPARMRFINRGAVKRYHDLARIEAYGANSAVLFNIFRANAFSLPIDITMVERHPYGSQAFFPIGNRPFLVVVAQDRAGVPQQPQAFLARAGQGVNYRANVWHHPLLALDELSDFVVIDRAGQENNLEEYFYDSLYRISSLDSRTDGAHSAKTDTICLEELNAASPEIFCAALSGIFEHSPWIAAKVAPQRPFASVDALHRSLMAQLLKCDEDTQIALIRTHPDLAGKAARQGTLTDASQREQNRAGLDKLSDEELDTFQRLNAAYRECFGFPYIIAVRGFARPYDKTSILTDMRERLNNSPGAERRKALRHIARITQLRLKDLLGE